MTKRVVIEAGDVPTRIGRRSAEALAAGIAFVAYLSVFALTRNGGWGNHLVATARNVVPLALLALAVRSMVERHVAGRGFVRQAMSHLVLATLFTLGWYWLLTVAGGVLHGESALRFTVAPFLLGQAFEWQLFQGLAVYTAVAALSHLGARPAVPAVSMPAPQGFAPPDFTPPTDPAPAVELASPMDPASPIDPASSIDAAAAARDGGLTRYFVRVGEDIVPVDVADIVSIAGADDYAQVTTATGSHLARMTLAEFEAVLNPACFLRVHRSRIVNTRCILRAEPAGSGRLLLHMSAGEPVPSSRAGAKLLRDRVL